MKKILMITAMMAGMNAGATINPVKFITGVCTGVYHSALFARCVHEKIKNEVDYAQAISVLPIVGDVAKKIVSLVGWAIFMHKEKQYFKYLAEEQIVIDKKLERFREVVKHYFNLICQSRLCCNNEIRTIYTNDGAKFIINVADMDEIVFEFKFSSNILDAPYAKLKVKWTLGCEKVSCDFICSNNCSDSMPESVISWIKRSMNEDIMTY